ncbi:MAG: sigma-70 family RNA polymerase sigma factor [Saprospiraceae bacterium]|jgi:RNA polymerase sigma factor (sigma-70 family)|nr:sigma-70 family RNA polymerase sigma factor [Saprospiraceae bacterium]
MNEKDFTLLVRRLKDRMYRIALAIVHDEELAEDVAQEVFIKVWEKKEELSLIENLDAYCLRMTRNLSIDKTRLKHYKSVDIVAASSSEHDSPSPHKSAEISDTMALVKKWVQELPASQREVLQLRDFEGLSYQEISDMLDIPLNQVKVYLFRARQFLRYNLEKTRSYGT